MSGSVILFKGTYSIRESDKYPIVTTEDGREWLVSSGSWDLLKHLKEGEEVLIHNRESDIGFPPEDQKKIDSRTDNYCNITCSFCKRTHV